MKFDAMRTGNKFQAVFESGKVHQTFADTLLPDVAHALEIAAAIEL